MFTFFQKSLRNKILFLFIVVGFLPFITLLIYTIFLSETKIVNQIVTQQLSQTEGSVKLLEKHLKSLSKELNFLSSLDIMDDILAEDIDKRVSRLLSQKEKDLGLDVSLLVVNLQEEVIASSDKKRLLSKFPLRELLREGSGFIEAKRLYLYSEIYASFDETKKLGFLVLEYNLENLKLYLNQVERAHSYIINTQNGLSIGEKLPLTLSFDTDETTIINEEHVIVYERVSELKGEWYFVYAVDKSVALAFLYDFIRFTLYISVIIFFFILYISFRYSKGVVRPIEKLTRLTQTITKTQNYAVEIEWDKEDEIAILTNSFNKMTKTTSEALEKLEEENRLRLKRFTQLIELFNTIIQTQTEDECIKVSIGEIGKLRDTKDLYFIEDKNLDKDENFTQLYVSDFETNSKVYIGSISLDMQKIEDKNETDFYNAISSMITLQLDKIRLIKKTELASNAKSMFISNMSHELRTPLNSIMGAVQYMISYESLSDEQIDRLGNIERSSHYLLEMINEILDIATIEAGKIEVNLEYVNIQSLLQSSCDMLSPLASDKELDFKFIYSNFEDKEYESDPKLLQKIVINLLSNAIKFTSEGSIVLELYEDAKEIHIRVKDTGIGVLKEDIALLFNDFTQLKASLNQTQKGTGLGLSLSKKLANILEGDIALFSEGINRGSEVVFSLKKKAKEL